MATLKEKFGKFELSKEQVKSVKGGVFTCKVTKRASSLLMQVTTHNTAEQAVDYCKQFESPAYTNISCTCTEPTATYTYKGIGGK